MGRRAATWLAITALLLAIGTAGQLAFLYWSARRSVDELSERRLDAVGASAAEVIRGVQTASLVQTLASIAENNQLDGVYVVDPGFHAVPEAKTLKLDVNRIKAAFAGHSSVERVADRDGVGFFTGYFPVPSTLGVTRVLAVEAGEEFSGPARRLNSAAIAAFGLAGALFVLSWLALFLAARAARKEQAASRRAESASVISRMAAMVAHEIRNPLGIIRGGAELLREQTQVEAHRALADDIVEEVKRLNELTEEFLLLGREVPLKPAVVEVARLVRDVCDGIARRYRSEALTFELSGEATVVADEQKLRQSLLNLVLNAAQAIDGRGWIRVEITTDGSTGTRILVSDSGPGIPADIAGTLFEPFVSTKATGTGLGLAVARKLIESHGGRLRYLPSHSGAHFEMSLPAVPRMTR